MILSCKDVSMSKTPEVGIVELLPPRIRFYSSGIRFPWGGAWNASLLLILQKSVQKLLTILQISATMITVLAERLSTAPK